MIFEIKRKSSITRLDLNRVIAAEEVTSENGGLVLGELVVYMESDIIFNIPPEQKEDFLKAWADNNKARETTSILVEDLESQEPESFAGLRYDCFNCGRENILSRENEGNLKRPSVIGENPKSIFIKCCYCDRAERKYLEDFKK